MFLMCSSSNLSCHIMSMKSFRTRTCYVVSRISGLPLRLSRKAVGSTITHYYFSIIFIYIYVHSRSLNLLLWNLLWIRKIQNTPSFSWKNIFLIAGANNTTVLIKMGKLIQSLFGFVVFTHGHHKLPVYVK